MATKEHRKVEVCQSSDVALLELRHPFSTLTNVAFLRAISILNSVPISENRQKIEKICRTLRECDTKKANGHHISDLEVHSGDRTVSPRSIQNLWIN